MLRAGGGTKRQVRKLEGLAEYADNEEMVGMLFVSDAQDEAIEAICEIELYNEQVSDGAFSTTCER